jgi:hypothetical protein
LIDLFGMSKINPSIPRFFITHDDDPHYKRPCELIKSKKMFSKVKVIFLVRDPRDIIVSLYFHKRFRDGIYNQSLHDYIRNPIGGFNTLISFDMTWAR